MNISIAYKSIFFIVPNAVYHSVEIRLADLPFFHWIKIIKVIAHLFFYSSIISELPVLHIQYVLYVLSSISLCGPMLFEEKQQKNLSRSFVLDIVERKNCSLFLILGSSFRIFEHSIRNFLLPEHIFLNAVSSEQVESSFAETEKTFLSINYS